MLERISQALIAALKLTALRSNDFMLPRVTRGHEVQHYGPTRSTMGQLWTTHDNSTNSETGVTLHQLLWLQIFLCVYNILCLTGLMPMPRFSSLTQIFVGDVISRPKKWSEHAKKLHKIAKATGQWQDFSQAVMAAPGFHQWFLTNLEYAASVGWFSWFAI